MPFTEIPQDQDPAAWRAYLDSHVEPQDDGCLNFTGMLDEDGYGRFRWYVGGWPGPRHNIGAHRAAWLARVGPIPEGLVIDHLCRNRRCVNVEHLDVVTNKENSNRSPIIGRNRGMGRPQSTSPNYPCGQPRSVENTLVSVSKRTGYTSRVCRHCNRERAAVYNAQRRALAGK